jgi:ectoine hydroxylase-related dioxygenase (phytanoyl-CoA dioxygenase family)
MTALADTDTAIRAITDEEVAFYRANGWVKLERLMDPELAAEVLERGQARMGKRAEAELDDNRKTIMTPHLQAIWRNWQNPSEEDEWFRSVSHSKQLARVASRVNDDRDVRWWSDTVMSKMPASEGGSRTPWHQDFPYHAMDRHGIFNFWFALVEIPPEMGTMRFLNGSHKVGPMGRVIHRTDGVDLLDMYPWIFDEYEVSEPLHLQPGDATIHNLLTVHAAPENQTSEPRWSYLTSMFPADVLYTGAQQRRTDDIGLEVNQPYDHPRFPLLPDPS